jgi:hypothetical protein
MIIISSRINTSTVMQRRKHLAIFENMKKFNEKGVKDRKEGGIFIDLIL